MKPKFRAAVVVVAVVALALTGCGTPEYRYPKSAEHHLYFKVPSTWGVVNQKQVDLLTFGDPASFKSQQKKASGWAIGYDAADEPDGVHLLIEYPNSVPTARGFVLPLDDEEQAAVSFDNLRDHFLPVSEAFREQIRAQVPTFSLTDFELIGEQLISPSPGIRGVRVVYSYRLPETYGGELKTFDQLILTNDASNLLYGLLIQCSATCYAQRQGEIQDVVSSFTVRSQV